MKKVLLSFSSRLTFYILTLTSLIFLCIAIVFHRYSRLREEKQAVDYTSVLQEKLIQRVDFELDDVENTVKREVYRVIHVKDTPDNIMPIVKKLVRSDSLIMGGSIAFVSNYYPCKGERFMEYACMEDYNGKERLVVKHLGDSTYNYLDMPWFMDVVNSKKGIWSDPYFDKGGGNKMMITFAYPIIDDNNTVFAVITADVSLEDLSLNMFSIRPYPDSYSFIVSRKGTYIAHPDKRNIMRSSIFSKAHELDNENFITYGRKMIAGEKGSFRSNINGVEVLACYAPLKRTGWSICSVCPYSTVMSQLGSMFGMVALILFVGLISLSICIRVLVKFMARPIQQLTEATNQIANGNFEATLPPINTKDDLRLLHDAFEHMQRSLLEYIKELKSTTQQKERISSELNIAHGIQMNIVPKKFSPFAECKNLDLYALLKPAKEVGGDLYDFFIRKNKLFFCVGDVSGKGIPASLVMAITSTLFRMTANSYDSPDLIIKKMNDTIADNNEANMFVTMFVGILDLGNGNLTYCNAGHNPPILISDEEGCKYLKVNVNLPIGVIPGISYKYQEFVLNRNKALLVYTDGLTEAENAKHQLFGEQRALKSAERHATNGAKDLIDNINKDLAAFVDGAEQSDDLTMLCLRLDISCSKEIIFNNDLADSKSLKPFIESICEDLHLSDAMMQSLNLALEEALVNAMQYAYPQGESGKIRLFAYWDGSQISFELTDKGIPFDPTQVKEVDTTLGVEDRPIGGLGIFLTRKIMDNVSYMRKNGTNKLTMIKNIQ